jgi:hypothetical protein
MYLSNGTFYSECYLRNQPHLTHCRDTSSVLPWRLGDFGTQVSSLWNVDGSLAPEIKRVERKASYKWGYECVTVYPHSPSTSLTERTSYSHTRGHNVVWVLQLSAKCGTPLRSEKWFHHHCRSQFNFLRLLYAEYWNLESCVCTP